jgi:hypothetical protein
MASLSFYYFNNPNVYRECHYTVFIYWDLCSFVLLYYTSSLSARLITSVGTQLGIQLRLFAVGYFIDVLFGVLTVYRCSLLYICIMSVQLNKLGYFTEHEVERHSNFYVLFA